MSQKNIISLLTGIIIILIIFIAYLSGKTSSFLTENTNVSKENNIPEKYIDTSTKNNSNKPVEQENDSKEPKEKPNDSGPDNDTDTIGDITLPEKEKGLGVGGITLPDNDTSPVVIGEIASPTKKNEGAVCNDNNECNADLYCKKKGKNACEINTSGICTKKPAGYFPCAIKYEPVCGCNNNTYDNTCQAARFGINILHEGVCS